MKELQLNERVLAIYDFGKHEEFGGTIIDINWFVANNIMAKVYGVKMENGMIDTFSEGYLIPLDEVPVE